MNWSFGKGVLVGAGALVAVGLATQLWGWVPWLVLAGGGVLGVRALRRARQKELPAADDPVGQIEARIEERLAELKKRDR